MTTARDKFYARHVRGTRTVTVPAAVIDETTEGEITAAIEIAYCYHPGERRTFHSPGEGATVEVLDVFDAETGMRVEVPAHCRDALEAACWAVINNVAEV
jgi:hypothetical protein